jgi:hypothetical protein
MQMVTSSIPTSLTAGRLEGIGVPELLWNLCRRRSTGVIHLTERGFTKKIYLADGKIIFAASSDPDDRLGEMLLREGIVRLAALDRAVARLHEGKRLGTLLVESGDLSPEQLVRSVVGQVRAIVLSVFAWETGDYRFVEGPLPTEELITLEMRTGEILLQGIRSVTSFTRIRRSVGSDRARYRAAADWRTAVEGLALADGERSLLERLEGDGETVDHLCEQVSLSNFEVYQALWAFRVLGAVQEVDRALEFGPAGADEGSLAAESFPALLVRMCRQGETGVLYVARGSHERTFHLREGRCVFATSNNPDDGLLAHLLRRGVISIRDREETAKRLLSNKRVGTILLEMGVIDEIDLARMVREQLSEVVYDTFRWTDGDWTFAAGELPTLEGITVDRSLEELVLEGVRRVTSWARIREGLGGLGTRLVLTPDYLSILDRMTVGPDDWALVARFRQPTSPAEACASATLPDFRVAQTLWALRLLGVVEEVAAGDVVEMALGGIAPESVDAPSERAAEPEPIAPVPVDSDASFVVTPPDAILPARDFEEDAAIPPSDWDEREAGREVDSAWTPAEDLPALRLSEVEEVSDTLVHEPWQLVAENARETFSPTGGVNPVESAEPVEPFEPVGTVASVEDGAPSDAAFGFEMAEPPKGDEDDAPRLPAWGLESDVVEADRAPAAAPDWALEEDPAAIARTEEEIGGEPSPFDSTTVRIPRDEVEAALRGDPAIEEPRAEVVPVPERVPEPEPEPEPEAEGTAAPPTEWDAPPNLDGEIARFNARQKAIFRVLRSEIGAGAVPFVRNCKAALPEGMAGAIGETTLLPDGTWDSLELKKAVAAARCDRFAEVFERLLEDQIERIRPQIGEKRAQALVDLLAGGG